MSVDVILFLGRILFLVLLFAFVVVVVLSTSRQLGRQIDKADDPAPGELVVVDPANSGHRPNDSFPLAVQTTVGRSPDNTIQISDSTISARHVMLTFAKGAWTIEDLNSRNGTLLNGMSIHRKLLVNYGDVIAVGSVTLKLVRQSQ